MTKEECIALLERYADYDGMGIPNLDGCKEAMKMAAELLKQPALPSNVDEAAEEWVKTIMQSPSKVHEFIYTYLLDVFRAGAKWHAGQEDTAAGVKSVCLQPKQKWSEEDDNMLDDIIFELEENYENISGVTYKIDWLESLRPQQKQELSEENEEEEQKPVEIHNSTDVEFEAQNKQLHDFKVFAAKQAKEHRISFVHDFEWDSFCGEILSYFNEKQMPAEWSKEDEVIVDCITCCLDGEFISEAARRQCLEWFNKHRKELLDSHSRKPSKKWSKEEQEYTLARIIEYLEDNDCPAKWRDLLHDIYCLPYIKQKPIEWSKEDDANIDYLIDYFNNIHKGITTGKDFPPSLAYQFVNWLYRLKSLFPQPKQESNEEKIMNFFDAIGDCGFSQSDILQLKTIWKECGLCGTSRNK